MVLRSFRLLALLFMATGAARLSAADLESPVRLNSGESPLDIEEIGHAAPCVTDWDGDGVQDLLVGQFSQGKLRIYRNVGSNEDPRYDGFEYFQAGEDDARVPTG